MTKNLKGTLIIVAILVIGFFWVKGFYNKTIKLEEGVKAKWSNVESSYQRRADLIPNLVNVAKGYADFEKSTLEAVVNARSKATSIQIDPSNISPAQLQQFQEAQSGLTSAMSRLLLTFERYPDLKANENFMELMNELERTENRINVERNRFNEIITPYNNHIRQFPGNFLAGFFDFDEMNRFEADKGSENAPKVDFNFSN